MRIKKSLLLIVLASSLGCKSTGSSIIVGEHFTLPELSDAGDNLSFKVYDDTKGAKIWTRENSEVKVSYNCATTNDYIGVVTTRSAMSLKVTVSPLAVDSARELARESTKEE